MGKDVVVEWEQKPVPMIFGFIMSLKKPEGYKNDKYELYGIKRYDVLVGVRIHL